MKKKIITLAMVAILAVSLTACGTTRTPNTPVSEEIEVTLETTVTPEPTATPTPETLFDRVDGKLYIGDEFTLGIYEQDNNLENGKEDIEWIVLSKNGEGYICISKYVLDAQYFCDEKQEIPNRWSDSFLRKWLNDTFYNEAFSDVDKLNLSKMKTNVYEWESLDKYELHQNTVSDMVRVINYGELDDNPSCVKVTEYAKKQGAQHIDDGTREHENCSNGWCMMSYHVDDVRKGISDGYSSILGRRGPNLCLASYVHEVPKYWDYGNAYRIGVGDELSYHGDVRKHSNFYSDFGSKVGVRPVIKIQFTK